MQNTNNACEDRNKANEIIIDTFDDVLANCHTLNERGKNHLDLSGIEPQVSVLKKG